MEAAVYDAVVSGLVLNFVARPDQMVAEMARAANPGGLVATYVWDYAGKMQFMRHFWNAAAALDPIADDLDEGRRFPLCNPVRLPTSSRAPVSPASMSNPSTSGHCSRTSMTSGCRFSVVRVQRQATLCRSARHTGRSCGSVFARHYHSPQMVQSPLWRVHGRCAASGNVSAWQAIWLYWIVIWGLSSLVFICIYV